MTADQYIQTLQERLHQLKAQWGTGNLDFWDFIGAEAGISPRSVYNFATGRNNAQNSRLTTIRGIEIAIEVAENEIQRQHTLGTTAG